MKIKIIIDSGLVYNPNSVMDAEQLQWLNSVPTESQLRHIGGMWGIEYEIEC